jgi:hypothetical protein
MKPLYLVLAAATLFPATSPARWKPQYASVPQEIQDWYKSRKLTDAAAKRFAFRRRLRQGGNTIQSRQSNRRR